MLAKEHREMMAGGTAQIPPCTAPPITGRSIHHQLLVDCVLLEGLWISVCLCVSLCVQVCAKGSEHQQLERGCDLRGSYAWVPVTGETGTQGPVWGRLSV